MTEDASQEQNVPQQIDLTGDDEENVDNDVVDRNVNAEIQQEESTDLLGNMYVLQFVSPPLLLFTAHINGVWLSVFVIVGKPSMRGLDSNSYYDYYDYYTNRISCVRYMLFYRKVVFTR